MSTAIPSVICALTMIVCTSLNVWNVTKSFGYASCTFTFMTFIFCLVMANMIDRRMR